jgi:hypothetical protein
MRQPGGDAWYSVGAPHGGAYWSGAQLDRQCKCRCDATQLATRLREFSRRQKSKLMHFRQAPLGGSHVNSGIDPGIRRDTEFSVE